MDTRRIPGPVRSTSQETCVSPEVISALHEKWNTKSAGSSGWAAAVQADSKQASNGSRNSAALRMGIPPVYRSISKNSSGSFSIMSDGSIAHLESRCAQRSPATPCRYTQPAAAVSGCALGDKRSDHACRLAAARLCHAGVSCDIEERLSLRRNRNGPGAFAQTPWLHCVTAAKLRAYFKRCACTSATLVLRRRAISPGCGVMMTGPFAVFKISICSAMIFMPSASITKGHLAD